MRKNHLVVTFKQNILSIKGHLNYFNVMRAYRTGFKHLTRCATDITIDFSGLTSSDSAGLALIIEWLKFSRRYQKKIQFLNIPENLIAIAKVARVDFFPIIFCVDHKKF